MDTLTTPAAPTRRRLHPLAIAALIGFGIPAALVAWAIAAAAVTGLAEAISGVQAPPPAVTAPAAPSAAAAPSAPHVADDDPRFDCRTAGNHLCGPTNDQHVTPGCYSGGRLVAPWNPVMGDDVDACTAYTAHPTA